MSSKTALMAAVVPVILLLCAPGAHADENQYLNQVAKTVSTPLVPSQALSLGNTVCKTVQSAVANGMTVGNARAQADAAVGRAQNAMGLSMSMADGMHLVDAAVDQLC